MVGPHPQHCNTQHILTPKTGSDQNVEVSSLHPKLPLQRKRARAVFIHECGVLFTVLNYPKSIVAAAVMPNFMSLTVWKEGRKECL